MKSTSKKRTPSIVNLTVKRRYLTEREVDRLIDCARKHGRYGHRDATMILVAYRHGLRASEVCDLQWQQIELSEGRLDVHRVKNGIPSVHPIRGDEMRALRKLRRDYPKEAYVFVSERGGRVSGRPPRCHSRSTRTCCAMPVGSNWPMMAMTPGPCSTTSGTRTSSTRSGTPTWRRTASKTFGGTDDSGCLPRAGTPLRQIVTSRVHWRWHTLPRLALLRRNRGVDVFEQPVRTLVLGLLKLGWTQHSDGFRSALDDRSARRSPALQHLLNEVDARL